MRQTLTVLITLALSRAFARETCDDSLAPSCTESSVDSCCVPSPGRLEVTQSWNVQRGQWVVDAIRVVSCDGQTEYTDCDSARAYSPSKVQNLVEGHARHAIPLTDTSRSLGWGGIEANASDDDVAAVWAQHWARYGTCISTLRSECFDKHMPPGEEDAWNDPGPALFVKAIHLQSEAIQDDAKPTASEPHSVQRQVSLAGSPFLGTMKSNIVEQPKAHRLSFFAHRAKERALYPEHDLGGIRHEEL